MANELAVKRLAKSEFELSNNKKKILILCDYYLPGYKSGGGMRTIVNTVERFKDRLDFFIITRDHDGKLDRRQYKTVKINQWIDIYNSKIFYLSKEYLRISKIHQLISDANPDLIYSNSYFATLTLYLLIIKKLGLIPKIGVVIAPCGELSEGALKLNSVKKRVFIRTAKSLGLYKSVIWKASSELEKKEIEAVSNKNDLILIAPDLPPRSIFADYKQCLKPEKKSGEAKMVFLSRFMKKKNFKWLLENISEIKGKLTIDIYGPLEDAEYWKECQQLIKAFPDNIKVQSKGSVAHEDVLQTLVNYHFFIMPTLGENFGHIFLEALAAGCPLLISDKTPWLDLEKKGIGWDLSLKKPHLWSDKLNTCIELGQESYTILSENSRQFALNLLHDEKFEKDTIEVLKTGLNCSFQE